MAEKQLLSSLHHTPQTQNPYLVMTASDLSRPLTTDPPSEKTQRKTKKKNGRHSGDGGGLKKEFGTSGGGWFISDDSSLDLAIKSETYPDSESSRDSLDTMEVSQRIRDILMAHNIGQRQFAKHVLGLSQGTVSELLSKPKSWDKLTEKGRESYRKMRQWAGDQTNIIELKLIVSRTGKGSNVF